MKNRGQAVLEFLLIILIVIIYITSMVVPMNKDAQNAINDTDKIARANNETQKIANAIEKIALLGEGSRQTIDVFVPEGTTISCNNNGIDQNISFKVALSLKPYPTKCADGNCTKYFAAPTNTTLNCITQTLPAYTKTSVQITKSVGNSVDFNAVG